MELRYFGRTGIRVSKLCLGAMMFGGRTTPEDSAKIIDRSLEAGINFSLEAGINFIDTANVYNNGRSEEAVGAALAKNGKRQQVFLATKVHGQMGSGPNDEGLSRRHIIEQCEASLRRLGTDYIDLYQCHRPRSDAAVDETLRALDDLVRAGKVRYLGTSTWAAWQVVESLWASKELGLNRFVCEQPPYNILDRRIERELIPMAQTHGIAIIPWSPLAGGLLTGKYHKGAPPPEDSRVAVATASNPRMAAMYRRRFNDASMDVVEKLQPLAQQKGVALSQLALAWVMSKPGVTSAIIGPRTMEQLEDNLKALDVELSDEDHAAIDAIVPPGGMVSPYYEADFGPARYRW